MDQSDIDDINDREVSILSRNDALDGEADHNLQESEKGYEKIRVIGQGVFGRVHLVRRTEAPDDLLVMKQISAFNRSEEELAEMMKEARILGSLSHPNVVAFKDAFFDAKGRLCILMEFVTGGDLAAKLAPNKSPLPESRVLDWFAQIAQAIHYVHSKQNELQQPNDRRKVLHRDIKSANIFLSEDERTVKLGDFGLARAIQGTADKAMSVVGTPYYLSPEIVQNKPYSFKSDIWSLGVLLYEMCAQKWPFQAESIHFLALQILRGKYKPLNPANYSLALRNLVAQLLQIDPNKRPTMDQVISTRGNFVGRVELTPDQRTLLSARESGNRNHNHNRNKSCNTRRQ